MKTKINRECFLLGLETFALAVYFYFKPKPFRDDVRDHLAHWFFLLPSPWWMAILITGAVIALVAGWLVQQRQFTLLAIMILGGIWAVNLMGFIVQNAHFEHVVSMGTLYSGFTFIRILLLAKNGGRYS